MVFSIRSSFVCCYDKYFALKTSVHFVFAAGSVRHVGSEDLQTCAGFLMFLGNRGSAIKEELLKGRATWYSHNGTDARDGRTASSGMGSFMRRGERDCRPQY